MCIRDRNSRGWNQKNLRNDPYALAPSQQQAEQHLEGIFANGSQTAGAFGQALTTQQQQQAAQLQALAGGQQSTYQPVTTGAYAAGYTPASSQPTSTGPIDPRLVNSNLPVSTVAQRASQAVQGGY